MQPEPLLEQQVGRVLDAFSEVSRELAGAVGVLAGLDVPQVGTRAGDTAVAVGVSGLRSAIADLESVADDIGGVLRRHRGPVPEPADETTPEAAR